MKINQIKTPSWIGAAQVQIGNSMFYMNLVSTGMMILTFWYTAGYQISEKYLHWLSLWIFVVFVFAVFIVVMLLDFIVIMPSRMAFQNQQACKHENPAMDELKAIRADIRELRAELGLKH